MENYQEKLMNEGFSVVSFFNHPMNAFCILIENYCPKRHILHRIESWNREFGRVPLMTHDARSPS